MSKTVSGIAFNVFLEELPVENFGVIVSDVFFDKILKQKDVFKKYIIKFKSERYVQEITKCHLPDKDDCLDIDGIIKVGSEIKSGDILIGIRRWKESDIYENFVEDYSIRATNNIPGIVTNVKKYNLSKNEVSIEITIRKKKEYNNIHLIDSFGSKRKITKVISQSEMPFAIGDTADVIFCEKSPHYYRDKYTYDFIFYNNKELSCYMANEHFIIEFGDEIQNNKGLDLLDIKALFSRKAYSTIEELLKNNCKSLYKEGSAESQEVDITEKFKSLFSFLKSLGLKVEIKESDSKCLQIGLASSEELIKQSSGEVKRWEGMNFETTPVRDGLFCQNIFGPIVDYQCACGRKKTYLSDSMFCERCGVEYTSSIVRRTRVGHIKLAAPIIHPWFEEKIYILAQILKMSRTNLIDLISERVFVIISSKETEYLSKGMILSLDRKRAFEQKFSKDDFLALTGVDAIKRLLKDLNIDEVLYDLRKNLEFVNNIERPEIEETIKILEVFKQKNIKLTSIIMDVLPVLPPYFRPAVIKENDTYIKHEIHDLYTKIIMCNEEIFRNRERNYASDFVWSHINERKLCKLVQKLFIVIEKSAKEYISQLFKRNDILVNLNKTIKFSENLNSNICVIPYGIACKLFENDISSMITPYCKDEIQKELFGDDKNLYILENYDEDIYYDYDKELEKEKQIQEKTQIRVMEKIQKFDDLVIQAVKRIIKNKIIILFLDDDSGERKILILKIKLGSSLNVEISKGLKEQYNLISGSFKLYVPRYDESQEECKKLISASSVEKSEYAGEENIINKLINNYSQMDLFASCLLEEKNDINDKFFEIMFGKDLKNIKSCLLKKRCENLSYLIKNL